jgi:hypothetical protein
MKHTTKLTREVKFKDPFGKRRHAKTVRFHTVERNFASGGAVSSDIDPWSSAKPKKKPARRAWGGRAVGKHDGVKALGRLDKAARGIQKRQEGGPVRPALPAQASPAAAAAPAGGAPSWAGTSLPSQANPAAPAYGLTGATPAQPAAAGGQPSWAGVSLPPQANPAARAYGLVGGAPPGGPAAGMGRPAWAGMGLPAQAAPAALAALAARPALPTQAMGARPFGFWRGGPVRGSVPAALLEQLIRESRSRR